MSRLQSARRRLALLAGSSFVLAGSVSLAVGLAPTTAFAANECGNPNTNAAAADSFVCPDATYATGVIYSSNGALSLFTPGAVNVGTGGFQMTGNGTDALSLDANGIISNTAGYGVNATGGGAITISAGGVTGSVAATNGISAVSSGGAVSVTTGAVTTNVVGSTTAIEARTTAGNGAVAVTTTGAVTGRLRGILARSSGTGTLTLTLGNSVGVNTTTTGGGVGQIAGIEASSGTGLLRIDVNGGNVSGVTGNAIKTTAGGSTTINIAATRVVSAVGTTNYVMDLVGATGVPTTQNSPTTIANAGIIRSTTNSAAGYDDLVIRASGGRVVINNSGRIAGAVDFSGVNFTGAQAAVTFNVTASDGSGTGALGWHTAGLSTFSPGADILSTSASGTIGVGLAMAATFDFGAGTDALNNAGVLDISGGGTFNPAAGSTLTLLNLEALNNSGTISFGGPSTANGTFDVRTDDRLVGHGLNYVSNNGRMTFNVNFSTGMGTQLDCSAALIADCADLTGGTTSGTTGVVIYSTFDAGPGPSGAYDPVGAVLVDVNGGTTAAGHFVLDPSSDGYVVDPNLGGIVSRAGLFYYDLTYDAENQRHILVGLPKAETLQFATLANSVQSLWRTASGTWFDRQADVRGGEGGAGVWGRVSGDFAKRDLVQSNQAYGSVWNLDNSYEQSTFAVTGGVDYVAADGVTVGMMLSYLDSEVAFETTPTAVEFKGGSVGAYASYVSGPFYLDALANGTVALMDQDPQALGLEDGVLKTRTVYSLGGQLEAGYRIPVAGALFVEPLAGLSYIRSRIDGFSVPGATVEFEDSSSLRAGLGARLGLDVDLGGLTMKASLIGRAWEELQGESEVVVTNDGPRLVMGDDLGGTFGEVAAGVSLFDDGGLSGFLDGGMTFRDGYRNANVSAGLRYRW